MHPNARIDVECIDVRGTIVIDMSEVEEYQLDATFLHYTCGSTEDLHVTTTGQECSITTSTSEGSGRRALSASITCPDNSLARGTFIDTLTC